MQSIKCVFVPVFGDPIELQKSINPGCEYRILKQYFLERSFYIIHDLKKLTIDQRIMLISVFCKKCFCMLDMCLVFNLRGITSNNLKIGVNVKKLQ